MTGDLLERFSSVFPSNELAVTVPGKDVPDLFAFSWGEEEEHFSFQVDVDVDPLFWKPLFDILTRQGLLLAIFGDLFFPLRPVSKLHNQRRATFTIVGRHAVCDGDVAPFYLDFNSCSHVLQLADDTFALGSRQTTNFLLFLFTLEYFSIFLILSRRFCSLH